MYASQAPFSLAPMRRTRMRRGGLHGRAGGQGPSSARCVYLKGEWPAVNIYTVTATTSCATQTRGARAGAVLLALHFLLCAQKCAQSPVRALWDVWDVCVCVCVCLEVVCVFLCLCRWGLYTLFGCQCVCLCVGGGFTRCSAVSVCAHV